MALGKVQIEELNALADLLKRQPEIVRLEVTICRQRAYTREFGSGRAITVTAYECYPGEADQKIGYTKWVANCQYDHTALDKGREIARYLVDQGCPKERVKLVGIHIRANAEGG